jgi:prepilin-type N-terminal cleavage/methylation domain-containing protein
MPNPRMNRHASPGFTLVEMAVVLLILSLLAGSLGAGLSSHLARRAERATDDALDEARDPLLGYALRKGHFPCPAKSPQDGAEDRSGGSCARHVGLLPWATLGIHGMDGWAHRLRYAITPAYTRNIVNVDDGTIEIVTRNLDGAELKLTTAGGLTPVVILSHGPNGLGAVAADGSLLPAPLTGSDEARNTDTSGRLFVSRSLSENPGAPGGAFDDRVSWISPNLIAHRLIGAGRLP